AGTRCACSSSTRPPSAWWTWPTPAHGAPVPTTAGCGAWTGTTACPATTAWPLSGSTPWARPSCPTPVPCPPSASRCPGGFPYSSAVLSVTIVHALIEGSHESSGGMMKRTWLALAAGRALVLTSAGAASATERLPAGDAPPGFWWGTDSFNVSVPGKAPYSMPFLGGAYGGYIGMTGNWAYWQGCSGQEHFIAYSSANAAQAHTNFVTYHKGV